jgi:exodeoxyribonuclease-3
MKLVTWNVNSVRARLPRLLAMLERHRPDVVCLQETKARDPDFPAEPLEAAGYTLATHGQKSYNGVAVLAREPLEAVERGFEGDPLPAEARLISGRAGDLRIVNLYVVNGKAVGTPHFERKLAWLDALARWLEAAHDPAEPLVLLGDFNIAPEDRDVHDPELWRGRVLCSDPERARLRRLVGWGLVDLLRLHEPSAGIHTWWDYRGGAFPRNQGLRIDLALGTRTAADRCRGVEVDREERKKSAGEGAPSDHAPVIVHLEP